MSDETQSPNAPIREAADGSHPLSAAQLSEFQFHIFFTGHNTWAFFPGWVFKAGNWIWKE